MMKKGIEDTDDVARALLDEFKLQRNVKTYSRISDDGDFLGFDSLGGKDLAAIPKRVYEGLAKPPWATINHLLNALIPKKLFRALITSRAQGKSENLRHPD